MRKSVLFGAAFAALATAGLAPAATFNGNGAGGFGGPIGNSVLTVTDVGSTINFSLQTSGFGDALAVYLDTTAGGFASTATLADTGDGGRRTLSGTGDGVTRSTVTFAPGFLADYGISVQPGNFAGVFNLTAPAGSTSFPFVNSANLGGTATTVTFSVNKADVGLPASGGSFSFVASLLNPFDGANNPSTTVFRSNETIGTSVSTPVGGNVGDNPGSFGALAFTTSNTVALPEPASLAVLGLGAAGLLRRRK